MRARIPSETETFKQAIRIGVSDIDLSYFMSVCFSNQGSATRDSTGPLTENCDLTATTAVPLVSVSPFQEGILRAEFRFVINGELFPTSAVEAVVLSPAVWEQLQVDACARRFVICDPEIDSADFSSLQGLLSGMEIVVQKPHQKSLILHSRQFWNIGLEPWGANGSQIRRKNRAHSQVTVVAVLSNSADRVRADGLRIEGVYQDRLQTFVIPFKN
jgi:hypothetical protein